MGPYSAVIAGTGSYVPAKTLTNKDLEKIVDTSDEWITTRTGIKVRHISSDDETTATLGAEAAKIAIENAGYNFFSKIEPKACTWSYFFQWSFKPDK